MHPTKSLNGQAVWVKMSVQDFRNFSCKLRRNKNTALEKQVFILVVGRKKGCEPDMD